MEVVVIRGGLLPNGSDYLQPKMFPTVTVKDSSLSLIPLGFSLSFAQFTLR